MDLLHAAVIARVIVRLSESMLDGYLVKEEIQENSFYATCALLYLCNYTYLCIAYIDKRKHPVSLLRKMLRPDQVN